MEFIDTVEEFLEDGNITCMADLHSSYLNICTSNGLNPTNSCVRSRRELKQLLENEIPGIDFCQQKRRNESERVCLKSTKDAAVSKLEEADLEEEMKILLVASKLITKCVSESKKWNFSGKMTVEEGVVPDELKLFFK